MLKVLLNKTSVLAATAMIATAASSLSAEQITIGTGSPQGVYYQVGRAICRLIKKADPVEGLDCKSYSTVGSANNLMAVRAGKLHVGIAQSDVQALAVHGQGTFAAAGPDESLRALFSVHSEPFTLVVRKNSGIASLSDLVRRRVNIGNPGSGQRGTMEAVMQAMGWSVDDFALSTQLNASEHSFALCNNRVEAIVYTVGHPNPSVAHATGLCDAQIVNVTGPEIDAMIAATPHYARTEIPGGIYSSNPDTVNTFGVIATAVVSAELDEDTAYQIVAHVFDNIDKFRAAHPALGSLDPNAMTTEGLTAPLHPGAIRYYEEHGIPYAALGQ
ncbi:TAXI family TRAP transporter solute-binding subunit [Roseivivax sp. CAU 1753]